MARYKPAADKIAEHFALKAKAQAIVSLMNTNQLRNFLSRYCRMAKEIQNDNK